MNSFAPINPALVDVALPEDGYPAHLAAGDTTDVLKGVCGDASRDFPQSLWIEPKDWPDKCRDNDKYHTWPMNYIDRYTVQSPTHECTTHSLRAGFECARNRQLGVIFPDGPKKDFRYAESAEYGSVWVSVVSVYAEANPAQWGGASIRGPLEIAVKRGFLPDKIQPREYNFKHAITGTAGKGNNNQSGGQWTAVRDFPQGWQETAKWFKPIEVIFPETWEQAVCLILHGYVIHVGRSGHAVPWAMWNCAEQKMAYPDSYDVTRYDSLGTVKSAARGSFAIATVTTPDDWMKPTGDAA